MDVNHLYQIVIAVTEAAVEHTPAAAQAATEATQEAAAGGGGVLGLLGINWKLFVAQLVNFGIILFIFWKWIVKPIGNTLTARQEKIEAGLKNAEQVESDKKSFEIWKADEMKKARQEAEAVITNATATAEKIKQETMAGTADQANKLLEQTRAAIEMEKQQMLKDVKREVAELVVSASEKILKEKLTDKKDHELIKHNLGGMN